MRHLEGLFGMHFEVLEVGAFQVHVLGLGGEALTLVSVHLLVQLRLQVLSHEQSVSGDHFRRAL